MKRGFSLSFRNAGGALALASTLLLAAAGCTRQAPVAMAPPVQPAMAPPMNGGMGAGGVQPGSAGVYQWQDVPVGQQVPVARAVFDQGGYQIYAQSGETIVVPFANQNMYVMKFGMSNDGSTYFINDGQVPTLYVPRGGFLENTMASNARWYPFPQNYAYTQPVYMGLAPTWNDFLGMGWYPGMSYYGGYWGYHPYGFSPMAGLMINIGGHPYYGWNSYRSYYYSNPLNRVYVRSAPTYRYNSVGRQASSSFGRSSFGSSRTTTGSFGRTTGRTYGSSGSFGRSTGSTGSFGRAPGPSTFGRSTGTTGSFGRSSGFGTSSSSRPSSTGSFGSGSSGFGSSSRRSSGSFGSGSSGYSSFGRSSSGSFGGSSSGSRSSSFGGGSFSSGRSSSFGGGSSSRSSFGGGSFGRRR